MICYSTITSVTYTFLFSSRTREAQGVYERALELDATNPDILYNVGRLMNNISHCRPSQRLPLRTHVEAFLHVFIVCLTVVTAALRALA